MNNQTTAEKDKLSCLEFSLKQTASIRVKSDDGRSYFFSTSHFLDGIQEANPDLTNDAPPERLTLRFTTGDVVMLGSSLGRVEDRLTEGTLRSLQTVAPRFVGVIRTTPVILSIRVQRKEQL